MARAEPIRSILIVGGGTAGWIAASLLNRLMQRARGKVTLVESPDIGTIGVGEATVPSMVQFVRAMGFDEAEFMRACSASYKNAIRFHNWIEPGHEYWHPFGLCGGRINGMDLFHFWLKRRQEAGETRPYSDWSLQGLLAQEDRAPRPVGGGNSPVIETGAYAYHFDASEFAAFLRTKAIGEGVEHIYGQVEHVAKGDDGAIASVRLVGGREIAADLYIDCSGFAGLLAEKALGDRWIDWSDMLLNDRAVALPVPRDGHFPAYTRATAMEAGWIWQIPLASRTGAGYVYSSRHIDEAGAERRLVEVANFRRARTADPRHIRIRVGRRTQFWSKNCVAIGLAAGFVEPLESTGIHFIIRGAELLVDYFPDRAFDEAVRRAYNGAMRETVEEVRDFLILHYIFNRREEPYWRDARSVALPDSLKEKLALYDEAGMVDAVAPKMFREPSWHFILSGSGRLPRRPMARADVIDMDEVARIFGEIRAQNRRVADALPAHRDYLAALHRQAL